MGCRRRIFSPAPKRRHLRCARRGFAVGARILRAIEATRRVVSCNTNLGIVLLGAPLAHAAVTPSSVADLRLRLQSALAALTIGDAEQAYRAIRLAAPGGLGRAERHDVAAEPQVTLLDAMREAAGRDRVAGQYASGYEDVFDVGMIAARRALALEAQPEQAVARYLPQPSSPASPTVISSENGASPRRTPCGSEAKQWQGRLWDARGTAQAQAVLEEADARLKCAGDQPRYQRRSHRRDLVCSQAWRSCCRRSTSRVPFELGGLRAANHR